MKATTSTLYIAVVLPLTPRNLQGDIKNGNWSYYFSQINIQATRDGLKSIPGILRATIPTITKSAIKSGIK